MTTTADLCHKIQQTILSKLEAGIIPWQRPWKDGLAGAPRNLVSKKIYRGGNLFWLSMQSYSSPFWGTFNQIKAKGGSVRKGQKGTHIFYFSVLEKDDGQGGKKKAPMFRVHSVFNIEQCEGIVMDAPTNPLAQFEPIEACEKIVNAYSDAPTVTYGGAGAAYSPSSDSIRMPAREQFHGVPGFYSTLFHELAHSTGHPKRLDREGIRDISGFGTCNYSKEELVAELTASVLCAAAGIEMHTLDNSAAYIEGWYKRLKYNSKFFTEACSDSQKAVDYMIGSMFTVGNADDAGVTDEEVELATA